MIGLDIWRDIPVPKSGVHLQQFNDALLAHTNIIGIFTLGGIAPPGALMPYPDRLGFNDNFPVDDRVEKTTPKVRRSMLYCQAESGQRLDALPFRVASVYLGRQGIAPKFDAGNSNSFQFGKAQVRALQPNDGPYVGADAAGMQFLLNFKHPNDFTRFTVSDALAGKIPKGSLRDKIVLVGMNAPSVSDERVTPIRYSHRGIELQSLTILQLLRAAVDGENALQFWAGWQQNAWMLVWCLLGGVIGYRIVRRGNSLPQLFWDWSRSASSRGNRLRRAGGFR